MLTPKIPSCLIMEVATAIAQECRQELVAIRPGEKIHANMISSSVSFNTGDIGAYYAILPAASTFTTQEYCAASKGTRVAAGFACDSASDSDFLSVAQLRQLIEVEALHSQMD